MNENFNRMCDDTDDKSEANIASVMTSALVGMMAFQVISDILNNDEEHEKRRTGFGKFRKRKKTNNNMDRIL